MSKRTILVMIAVCICLLAVFAYVRQSTYNRFNTGEVTTIDARGSSALAPPASVTPRPSKKEPAGHPMEEPDVQVADQSGQQPNKDTQADTSAEFKPEGVTPAVSGRFQVYRQGDLTWRVDTENGSTCVLFATDEEWLKPRVYRRACEQN